MGKAVMGANVRYGGEVRAADYGRDAPIDGQARTADIAAIGTLAYLISTVR